MWICLSVFYGKVVVFFKVEHIPLNGELLLVKTKPRKESFMNMIGFEYFFKSSQPCLLEQSAWERLWRIVPCFTNQIKAAQCNEIVMKKL